MSASFSALYFVCKLAIVFIAIVECEMNELLVEYDGDMKTTCIANHYLVMEEYVMETNSI